MESSMDDGESAPSEKSFFKYARMDSLSEETLKRLQECCFKHDEFGSELCQLFHSLILYYNMQIKLEKQQSVSVVDPVTDEPEKSEEKKSEELDERNQSDEESDFEEGEVIDTEDEVESISEFSTDEGEIEDETNDEYKKLTKREQQNAKENTVFSNRDLKLEESNALADINQGKEPSQVSTTQAAIAKRSAMMLDELREYEESIGAETTGTHVNLDLEVSNHSESSESSRKMASLASAFIKSCSRRSRDSNEDERKEHARIIFGDHSKEADSIDEPQQQEETYDYIVLPQLQPSDVPMDREGTNRCHYSIYGDSASSVWNRVGNLPKHSQVRNQIIMPLSPPLVHRHQRIPPNYNGSSSGAYSHGLPSLRVMNSPPPEYSRMNPVSPVPSYSADFGCRKLCAFCSHDHSSEECTMYRSYKQRESRRLKLHLCIHCLEPANKKRCFLPTHRRLCRKCTRHNHHPTMCSSPRPKNVPRRRIPEKKRV